MSDMYRVFLLFITLFVAFQSVLALTSEDGPAILRISEVMWMGSDLSTADEWLELAYVSGPSTLSLNGYRMTVLNCLGTETTVATFSAQHAVHQGEVVVVSNYDRAHSRLDLDPFFISTSMSLPNTKLFISLYDAAGALIDTVDDGVGNPMAGQNDKTHKASMERIDLLKSGADPSNWRTATERRNLDVDSPILATPGYVSGLQMVDSSSVGSVGISSFESSITISSSSIDLLLESSSEESSVSFNGISTASQDSSSECSETLSKQSSDSSVSLRSESSASSDAISSVIQDSSIFSDSSSSVIPLSPDASIIPSTSIPNISNNSSIFTEPIYTMKDLIKNSIQISEILPNPIGSDTNQEWMELKNTSDSSIDLSGMIVTIATRSMTIGSIQNWSGSYLLMDSSLLRIPLVNAGSTVTLTYDGEVIDTYTYPELPEGVSISRITSEWQRTCTPTPAELNRQIPPIVSIIESQNQTSSIGHITLNFEAIAEEGALTGAQCSWDYGDSNTTEGCNPGLHSLSKIGRTRVALHVSDACGGMADSSYEVEVFPEVSTGGSSGKTGTTITASSVLTPSLNCTPSTFSGVTITELMPNPVGVDDGNEWIEFRNDHDQTVSLCGWWIEDHKRNRFALNDVYLQPKSYGSFDLPTKKFVLRNSSGSLFLIAPSTVELQTGAIQSIHLGNVPSGKAYAVSSEGRWLWSGSPTKGQENVFATAINREEFLESPLVIASALPNPEGVDTYAEELMLENRSQYPFYINGWKIRANNKSEYLFGDAALAPFTMLKVEPEGSELVLPNKEGVLRLIDRQGRTRSILTWGRVREGEIIRKFSPMMSEVAQVEAVVDGDTVIVRRDPTSSFAGSGLRGAGGKKVHETDRSRDVTLTRLQERDLLEEWANTSVRLLGIDAPEIHSKDERERFYALQSKQLVKAYIENKKIELQNGTEGQIYDVYDRRLSYVATTSMDLQEMLLLHGLAWVNRASESNRLEEFIVYEEIARENGAGIWADDSMRTIIDERIEEQEERRMWKQDGVTILIKPGSGSQLIASTNVPVDLKINYMLSEAASGVSLLSQEIASTDLLHGTGGEYLASLIPLMSGGTIRVTAVCRADYCNGERSVAVWRPVANTSPIALNSVRISEVYPSPKTGEGEWVELANTSDQVIDVGGMLLDDREGGSKPYEIPLGTTIAPYGFTMIHSSQSHLSFTNGGEEVRLLALDHTILDRMVYGKTKTGWSSARIAFLNGVQRIGSHAARTCSTSTPTPGESNRCTVPVKKRAVKKAPKLKKSNRLLAAFSAVSNGEQIDLAPREQSIDLWGVMATVLAIGGGASIIGWWMLRQRACSNGSISLPLSTHDKA